MRAEISDRGIHNIAGKVAIVLCIVFGIQNLILVLDLIAQKKENVILTENYNNSLNSIDQLKRQLDKTKFVQSEIECLAKNIYFEAGNQSQEGKLAVAQVTRNRVNDGKYPNTYCEVVFQSNQANRCQFSWTCDGKSDRPRNLPIYESAKTIAEDVYYGRIRSNKIKNDVLYYHANYVNPTWNREMQLTANIGNHQFYRTYGD